MMTERGSSNPAFEADEGGTKAKRPTTNVILVENKSVDGPNGPKDAADEERGNWAGKCDFFLSALGYAVQIKEKPKEIFSGQSRAISKLRLYCPLLSLKWREINPPLIERSRSERFMAAILGAVRVNCAAGPPNFMFSLSL